LPSNLEDFEISASELGPYAAWKAVVRFAAEEALDAVILAGDVVQEENCRFEAFGPLHQGVSDLVSSGAQVFAVAGNHDVDALPHLAELIPSFRLLGRGGRWEMATIARAGTPLAHLYGWSFPARRFTTSPLEASFPRRPSDALPAFGVLHCDLDASRSAYAPVRRDDLLAKGLTRWFLGHVHTPSELFARSSRTSETLYLGSLVGLDPGESGEHGALLVEIGDDRELSMKRIPLAPLLWEELDVELSELASIEELPGGITRAIDSLHDRHAHRLGEAKAVGVRLHWRGRSPHHRELRRTDPGELLDLRFPRGGVLYFVHEVVDHARASLELERLARTEDPPGLLARALLSLDEGTPEAELLLRQARRELARVAETSSWNLLEPLELDDAMVRDLLLTSGTQALEELLAQLGPSREAVESVSDRPGFAEGSSSEPDFGAS
jgi:hypothetical protein